MTAERSWLTAPIISAQGHSILINTVRSNGLALDFGVAKTLTCAGPVR